MNMANHLITALRETLLPLPPVLCWSAAVRHLRQGFTEVLGIGPQALVLA